ncbi:MAG: hypothetical protein K2K82_00665 [Muribaculaceae bacterium]|nr:hypothetical protein [Muribaculaceae bacterium]
MKIYTHYLYDLAENGKAFGMWYTRDEVIEALCNGFELFYNKELTHRVNSGNVDYADRL